MLEKVERLIDEINKLHLQYSKDYFETGKVEKVNLKHTFAKVPTQHILSYRLNLHESINDYLMRSDTKDITFYYRVKTAESILDKIARFQQRAEGYPVNSILNDIFGVRMILNSEEISLVMERLDDWQEKFGLKNWYLRDKDEYTGIHIYFKNKNNFYYPWELQLWDEKDLERNIASHIKYKRHFVN
ncbi:hypothetical protein ABID29_000338 [Streptococcus rupicaprae]|uniref:RelA/SpoT domain-containing protein n=1 Tax=Streptococcus rupicaprae TaxID=759619 RepID=A0ABV2FF87_9STRE